MEQLHKDSGATAAPPRSQHEFAFALGDGGGDSRQLRLLHVVIFATIPVVLITTIITWSTWSFAASRITKEINANRDLLRKNTRTRDWRLLFVFIRTHTHAEKSSFAIS